MIPLAGCGGLPQLRGTVADGRVRVSRAEFDTLAGENRAIGVDIGTSYPVLLLREGDDFRALSSRCTHQACRVSASPEFVVCPCHGSTFDREGNVLRGPAQTALPSYPVTVKG
ncbi:MAG: Rieske (2Fe-2S) protein, partial [Gemmatimonadetes bacterium]|nr:Rieske (2Fe-2S) protein [Gemmatimonadota bacterium]